MSRTSVICFLRVWFKVFITNLFPVKCIFFLVFGDFSHIWHCARSVISKISPSDTKFFNLFLFYFLGQNKHFWKFKKKFFFMRVWYAIYHTPGAVPTLLYRSPRTVKMCDNMDDCDCTNFTLYCSLAEGSSVNRAEPAAPDPSEIPAVPSDNTACNTIKTRK